MQRSPALPVRYAGLDAWRGVASLWVVLFHMSNTVLEPGASVVGDVLLHGWAGVFLFFPISGYCILAAIHTTDNATLGAFLRRRYRRIFPPYWASLAITLGAAVVALPFTDASLPVLRWFEWISVVTLTQGFLGLGEALNPVYWSLCFEEQFYLILAIALVCPVQARAPALLGCSALAVATRLPGAPAIPGLFVEHFLSFAVGMAVFAWFDPRVGRRFALATWGLAVVGYALSPDAGLGTALVASALMTALRPLDPRWVETWAGGLLKSLGKISFSLYLCHVPVGGRMVNLLRRVAPSSAAGDIGLILAGTVTSLVAGWLLYHLVERRFLNRHGVGATAPSGLAPVVSNAR